MISIEEPIPTRRLKTRAHTFFKKLYKALLHTGIVQRVRAHHQKILLTGGVLMFILVQQTDVVSGGSQKSEDVSSPVAQAYTACLFQKDVQTDGSHFSLAENVDCLEEVLPRDDNAARADHLRAMLAGHPMESMADALAQKDPQVAAFIVGIGKIESNWGKHSPWKAGVDCYNYWGYKTSGSRGQALGHACFGSPEEAVDTIATRLEYFVLERGKDTAQKLLVWKCGSSCATHDPAGVARWVGVVQTYSQKALAFDEQEHEQEHVSHYLALSR